MKIIKNLLGKIGFLKKENDVKESKNVFEKFPFLKRAVAINKKIVDDENRRIKLFNDQQLYEGIANFVNEFFENQNESLKNEVILLESELSILKREIKELKIENEILKKADGVLV